MDEMTERVPRELRTPITEAILALALAWEVWVERIGKLMADNPESDCWDPKSFFLSRILREAWDDPATNGDEAVKEIGLSLDGKRDPVSAPWALLQTMFAVVDYAVQAIKAEDADKHDEAWTYAAEAQYWAGILRAAWAAKMRGTKPAVELAKRRHAENYALIEDALKYWHENIDPTISASKAANELVRVVPLSHKKLAEVIAAEKKKQP